MSIKSLISQVRSNNQNIKNQRNKTNLTNDNKFCNKLYTEVSQKLENILTSSEYTDILVIDFNEINQSIYTKEDFFKRIEEGKYPFEKKYSGIIMNKKISEIENNLLKNEIKIDANKDKQEIKFVIDFVSK